MSQRKISNHINVESSNESSSSNEESNPPPSRRRLTVFERGVLYGRYNEIKSSSNSNSGAITSLANEYNMHPKSLARFVRNINRNKDNQRISKPGQRPMITKKVQDALYRISDANQGKLSARELAHQLQHELKGTLTPSVRTVQRFVNSDGWRRVRTRTIPLLTDEQKLARLNWAMKHRLTQWTNHVDIDEKYFYGAVTNGSRLVPPGRKSAKLAVKSKRYVPKVMVMTAVAKPNPRYSFDGRVGLWPITEQYEAKRSSVKHRKGEVYEKPCTMDTAVFVELMRTRVIPAIRRKMYWAKVVNIQLDNAPPHASLKELEAQVNQRHWQQDVRVRFVRQPAQSPDVNINDLGLYAYMQKLVDKKQRHVQEEEEIIKVVNQVWKSIDSTSIQKLYDLRKEVLKTIVDHQGGIDFDMPHTQ